ncbi:MAG TPA: acyl-CoA dehydrogenase family protein [Kofleriaceae bacterium]|nr:acyl-CoA dehydrogenase family protein [Kofleriaceae bacterium]
MTTTDADAAPFTLPEELRALHRETLRFARSLDREVREADRAGAFWVEGWRACGRQGLHALCLPPAQGGAGGGMLAAVVALQALGQGCRDGGLVFAVASQLLTCTLPIARHGSAAVREQYLRGLAGGELVAAQAVSEPGAGSDVAAVRTTARAVPGGWSVSGSKTFTTLGPQADLAIVLARTDDGELVELVIPRDGYRVSRPLEKIGVRTAPMCELFLEDAFVPEDHLLGTPGNGMLQFMAASEWERLGILAGSLGTMERRLELCVAYAREREQFGQPIGKFQAVAHRIAEMKLRVETSRLLLYHAAAQKDRTGRATIESALVKLHLSECAHANALDAVRVFGAAGCMEEAEVERELRDAVTGLVYSGTSDIQRNTIARLLGL